MPHDPRIGPRWIPHAGVFGLSISRTRFAPAAALLTFLVGCEGDWKWPWPDQQSSKPAAASETASTGLPQALRDTIGEQVWVEGLRTMRVVGYGLVVGLGDRGSTDCPREVRERLLKDLYLRPEFRRAGSGSNQPTPEMMIEDPDTAVVVIQGEIPAGATSGARFDVEVSALPGTQTTSLRGGWLYACELDIYRMMSPQTAITGQALGRAEGPVFLNPFSEKADAATRTTERIGRVVGGGVVTQDRRVRLVLMRPSYGSARRVADVINGRFHGSHKIAEPLSPSYVQLEVPRDYAADPKYFIDLVQHLYLSQAPGTTDLKTRQLADEIVKPEAPYVDIALAWEGIGKGCLPTVSKLYSHQVRAVRYHAARTGLRLGDDAAVEVVAEQASDENSPYRLGAIAALGRADTISRAARPLLALLDDADPDVRIAAYEALVERDDPEIETRRLGRGNFTVDLVPSRGENLIYARRNEERRIALLGDGIRLDAPLFYRHPSGELTLNAFESDQEVTVLHKERRTGRLAPEKRAGLSLPELLVLLGNAPPKYAEAPGGLGIDYSTVVHMLRELCETRVLNARFMLEHASLETQLGPKRPEGRPESEL